MTARQPHAPGTAPLTFVLVHGAWHGGWCWRRAADLLSARGHRVFTPTLTGLGDRAHLFAAGISLHTHVQDILSLVDAEDLHDFILVGHSYAGFIITGVADALRHRVAHYIYLDASLPPDMSTGSTFTWASFNPPDAREARLKSVREQGGGVALPPPPPSAYGVTDPADVAWVERHARPMPLGTYLEPFTLRNSGSNGLPRTYIACTNPPHPLLTPAHDRVRHDPTWSFTTLDVGHDCVVTAPDKVASLLLSL